MRERRVCMWVNRVRRVYVWGNEGEESICVGE